MTRESGLLMRFGFTAHPGFKSPILRHLTRDFVQDSIFDEVPGASEMSELSGLVCTGRRESFLSPRR